MENCRWGILGAGWIAQQFADDLPHSRNGVAQAVAARDRERARAFAERYQCAHYDDDYAALLARDDIDAVYIALTHNLHYEWARNAILAGKPVLVEKPFTINARQTTELFALAEQHGVFVMEAFWTKFIPAIVAARALIDDGAIGTLRTIEVSFGNDVPFDAEHRLYNPALGGGVLLDMGVYPLLLPLWLWGKPLRWDSEYKPAPTGVDADCRISAYWSDDRRAELTASLLRSLPNEARLSGTGGSVTVPRMWFNAQQFTLQQGGDSVLLEYPFPGHGYQFEADEVAACLARGTLQSDVHSWQDTLNMMEWLDAIRTPWGVRYPQDD